MHLQTLHFPVIYFSGSEFNNISQPKTLSISVVASFLLENKVKYNCSLLNPVYFSSVTFLLSVVTSQLFINKINAKIKEGHFKSR